MLEKKQRACEYNYIFSTGLWQEPDYFSYPAPKPVLGLGPNMIAASLIVFCLGIQS